MSAFGSKHCCADTGPLVPVWRCSSGMVVRHTAHGKLEEPFDSCNPGGCTGLWARQRCPILSRWSMSGLRSVWWMLPKAVLPALTPPASAGKPCRRASSSSQSASSSSRACSISDVWQSILSVHDKLTIRLVQERISRSRNQGAALAESRNAKFSVPS